MSADRTREAVNLCMAERGYMVIGIKSYSSVRYKVGQIIDQCCAYDLEQPFMVIAETNHDDWLAQIKLIAEKLPHVGIKSETIETGSAYYRVTTD